MRGSKWAVACKQRTRNSSSPGRQGFRCVVDSREKQSKAKFAKKHGLGCPLLVDPDHETAEMYGVWQEKSQYGRTYMGIVRTTYLIGPDGKVQKRWDKVEVDGHADEVLAALS